MFCICIKNTEYTKFRLKKAGDPDQLVIFGNKTKAVIGKDHNNILQDGPKHISNWL